MTDDPLFAIKRKALPGPSPMQEAEEVYERILRSNSRHLESIYRSGLIRLQQNRFADAEALFRRAVKIDKKSADAQHYLAIALTGAGHLNEAVTHYRKALNVKPHDALVHNNLGFVLQKLDRHEEAARHYRKALSINPNYPQAHDNLGNALQSLHRAEEAIKHYRQALALRPDDAGTHNNLASALAALNYHEQAIVHCEKALELAPGIVQARMNLANSLGAVQRLQDALLHYQKVISIDPTNIEAYSRSAFVLFQLGRVQETIIQCKKALKIKPDHADSLANLGFALRELGRVDEAIHEFEKAIAISPKKSGFYYALATSKRISASDSHFVRMQELAGKIGSLDVESQIELHFALGKAFSDIGDPDRSFHHLRQGNALKRQQSVAYDESKVLLHFDRVRTTFTPELLRDKKSGGDPSPVMIFIVGMPRSGTSLVEQILASHPKVFGAGERWEFPELTRGISGPGGTKFPEAVASMSSEQLGALGAGYLRSIQPLAPGAERIVDKMPSNFFHAGLIHLAVPNARIIHTRRDLCDTAISCFSTLFALGVPYAYDLAELGRYIRAYEKLMDHWRRVLPQGAMIEVQYEELVGNLEKEAKRLIDFCGLEWDDACLSFHKTERPVRTASVIQVRQPIYGSSVGRWRRYEKQLQPFLRALSE